MSAQPSTPPFTHPTLNNMTTMKTPTPLLELCEKATKGPYGYEYSEANDAFEIAPFDAEGQLDWDREVAVTADNNAANAQLIARLSPEVVKAVYEALAWAYNAAPEQSGLEMEAKRALALLDGTTAPSDLT